MNFMKQLSSTVLVLSFLLVSIQGYAQFKKNKLGEITDEYKNYSDCDFAPGSSAIVLKNDGYSYFDFSGGYLTSRYTTHKVIKILNKDGLDAANINFSTSAKLYGIQAATYNKVDGQWIRTLFDNDELFKENIIKKKGFVEYKIPMPNVSVGSIIEIIIELGYKDRIILRDWCFQDTEYPVLSSTYSFINYRRFIFYHEKTNIYPINDTLDEESGGVKYTAKNLPPLGEPESYSPSPKLFSSNIRFHLNTIIPQVPTGTYPHMNKKANYVKFNKYLMVFNEFGKHLKNKKGILQKLGIITTSKDDYDKASTIYKHIQSNIKWNKYHYMYPEKKIAETIKDKEGGTPDINMLLIACLKEAGIKSYPVLSSTRENGRLHPFVPMDGSFNYLLCAAEINGELVVLDASRKGMPFGMLSYELLNGNGYIIDNKKNGWIPLQKNTVHEEIYVVNLSIEDDEIKGDLTSKLNDHAAARYYLMKENSDLEKMEDRYKDYISTEWKWEDCNMHEFEIGDPIVVKGEISKEIDSDELIYIDPLVFPIFNENPFKNSKRFSPVDFPYQIKYKLLYNLSIPEGYQVEESPVSNKISLGENGSFIYFVDKKKDKISISITMDIKKIYFERSEYSGLHEFFTKMYEGLENVIVLKKI